MISSNALDEIVVFITCPSGAAMAGDLAHALIENQLAACVNIIPQVRSVYLWQGEVNDDAEQLLVAKSVANKFEDLCNVVKNCHPAEVPEIISMPISAGLKSYLDWLRAGVGQAA